MSKKKLLFILGILIILFVLLMLAIFNKKKGEVGVANKVGDLMATTEVENVEAGEIFGVNIDFRTGNEDEAVAISSLSFRLVYEYEGDPGVSVVDENGNPSQKIFPYEKIVDNKDWSFPVNGVRQEDGKLIIEFAAVNTSTEGFVNQAYMPVATVYFRADNLPDENEFKLEFDRAATKMMTKKAPPQDILNIPGNLDFTFAN